jgi:hypothetical protein
VRVENRRLTSVDADCREGASMSRQGRSFRGVVVAGRGLGARPMSQQAFLHAVRRLTDLTLVPGMLNVRLSRPFDGTLAGEDHRLVRRPEPLAPQPRTT